MTPNNSVPPTVRTAVSNALDSGNVTMTPPADEYTSLVAVVEIDGSGCLRARFGRLIEKSDDYGIRGVRSYEDGVTKVYIHNV
jgi:hypothetical protein